MIDKVDFMTMEEKLSDKDLQDILIEYEYSDRVFLNRLIKHCSKVAE